MQRITIIGNVGQDATIKQSLGSEFITFSVAVNEKFKNRDGVEVENTQWYNCLYQPKTMTVAQYLKKGTRVYLEGKPKVTMYDDKTGQPKIDFGVQVRGLELLSTVAGEKTPSTDAKPTENVASQLSMQLTQETEQDDLPF